MFLISRFGKKQVSLGSPPPPGSPPLPSSADTAQRDDASAPRVYQRAAALTYHTAPYPSDNLEGVFEALLLLAADKVDVNGASVDTGLQAGGWLGRAWRHVTDRTAAHRLQSRQADFLAAFSRQLELNPAEESNVVMVSCHCFVVSNGKLHFGTLYATNCGLYFCAAAIEVARSASVESAENGSGSSADSRAPEPLVDGMEFIKERVLFTDTASFLPSIFLEQKGNAPPYIQGVPNGVVAPNALQAFTVRCSRVIQFVGLHDVVVKPPRRKAAEREKSATDAVQDAPCTDVVHKREHALIEQMPSNLDTFKFCALLWRLWRERLTELDLPLENPAARYADPH